jgi:hypothetical protein
MDENNMNQFDSFSQDPANDVAPADNVTGSGQVQNTDTGFNGGAAQNTDFGFNGGAARNTDFGFDGGMAPQNDNFNIYGDDISGGYEIMEKKSKKGLIIGISVAAVVVIAALVTGLYFILRKTPEEIVKNAMKDTFAETREKGYSLLNDTLGLSEFSTEKADSEVTFTVDECIVPEYKGIGMTGYASVDATDEDDVKAAMGGSLEIAGESLSTDIKFVDSVLYYTIPELSDKTFKLTADDLVAIIQDAASSYDGSAVTGSDIDYSELYKKFKEVSETARKNFNDKITYERVGSESITLNNGKSVKTKKYTMTIPKNSIKEYVNEYVTAVVDYADENVTDEQWDELGITKENFEQIANMVPAYFGMLVTKDIVVDYYIADGKIVKLSSSYKVSGFTQFQITLDVDFMGDKFVTNDVHGELAMSAGGDDSENSVTYIYDRTSETKDGKWTVNDKATMVLDDDPDTEAESMSFESEQVFDSSTNDLTYTGKVTSTSTDDGIVFELDGNYSDINKGKSYTFNLNKFSMTDVDGEVALSVSGTSKVGDLGKTIEADPSAVKFDPNELDKGKLEDIIDKWDKELGLSALDVGVVQDGLLGDSDQTSSDNEEDTADAEISDEDFDDTEYQGIAMKTSSGYTIDIKEPGDYSRSYASEYTIDLYNYDADPSDIYYSWDTYSSIEDVMKTDLDSRVDIYGSDSVKVIETGSVELANGKTAQYQITSIAMYGSMIYYYDFYVNLEGDEYYTVTVTSWKSADLLQDIVDKFMSDDVVVISK